MSSREAQRLGLPRFFPRHWVFAGYCRIPKGRAPVSMTVRGTCASVVIRDGDRRIVRFAETWDSRQFRGPRSSRFRYLRHTWEFTLSKQLRVISMCSYGDHPPQQVG
jgi:hypothetical protein